MTPDQIFAKYDGKQVLNKYGAQCEAWAEQYARELGFPIPTANAKDHTGPISGYTWIPNSATAVPTKGSIVVWGAMVGQYGHIAVANGQGDTNGFKSYDQNWPLSENAQGYGTGHVHLQSHNYNGVLGWQRPNAQEAQVDPRDAAIKSKDDEIDNLKKAIAEKDDSISKLRPQLDDQTARANGLESELNAERASYEGQIAQLHDQVIDLQKQVADASQRPPEPAEGPVTTVSGTSSLQTVISFLKGLFNRG